MKKYIVDESLLVSLAKVIKNLKLQVIQLEMLNKEMKNEQKITE
jgi:hypothetical protein